MFTGIPTLPTDALWLDDLDPVLDMLRGLDSRVNPHLLQTAIEHLMLANKLVPRVHRGSHGHCCCVFQLSGL